MTNPSETRDSELALTKLREKIAAIIDANTVVEHDTNPVVSFGGLLGDLVDEFSVPPREAADTIDRLTSSGEAVGWRWRAKVNGEWGLWSVVDVDPNDWTWREHWEDLEVVPLSASPREGHVEVPMETLRKISEIIEKSSTIGAGDFFAIRAMLAALPHNQGETKP